MSKNFLDLISIHSNELLKIKAVAFKFIDLFSSYIGQSDKNYLDDLPKEKVIDLFLKVSGLLIKIIPIEHKVSGNVLLEGKEMQRLKEQEESAKKISDREVEILDKFLKLYKTNMEKDNE